MTDPVLYTYYRSSAAYRVRIALNLKGLNVTQIPVHLRKGEQRGEAFRALNPAGLVPLFAAAEGAPFGQSLAIMEYLEESCPTPALLPARLVDRAYAREIAATIACDIHPLGNLRVLDKLSTDYGATTEGRAAWNRHWMAAGFAAIEARLTRTAGRFAIGDMPGLADICIVPQLYNARRFGLDLSPYPQLTAVDAAARALPAFINAAPENQPDFEEG
ncbi:maleylacetoacetate isomerase [Acidocella aquatica]|uniref:Maleylacetoacetate isomerase n=1 Tax=Acidocella aquatica TaxID=1922313 RepID=A0ABQ6AFN4_9PROT|nr:maleylacetoacetate isomerase [Acidocella aquatica]GLR69018.1 maleylacetoacetate isomerase [Acidocella aquatica]